MSELAELSELDDAALLGCHVAGDPHAFGALFERHRDRLWATALRTMRDPEDAADALQDALISAFRRAASFRGDAAVTTWLHRIVVNACLDRLRSKKSRWAEPLEHEAAASADLGQPDHTEAVVTRDAVALAFNVLNHDQRVALVLVDVQGFSVTDAAQMLGCAPGTVKSRCSRGRARLASLLAELRP